MNRWFARLLLGLIAIAAWGGCAIAPVSAALPGMSALFAGPVPELGVTAGQLKPCPPSPNCVVSQQGDETHAIAPIVYRRDRATANATLLNVLGVLPRTTIVTATADYIRAEAASRLLGFVDDVEFYLPADAPVIEIRSAARLGESDLGVNRRRLEQIRLAIADLGI